MKRLALLAIILCAWLCTPAHAQFNGCSGFCGTSSSSIVDGSGFNNAQGSGSGPPAAPSYVFVASPTENDSGASLTVNVNIGTAASSRLVVAACSDQNSRTISTATLNGVSMNLDVNAAGAGVVSLGGASPGSGSQQLVVTWNAGTFENRGCTVWVGSNLTSGTVKQSGSGASSATVSVSANDLMFGAVEYSGGAGPAAWSSATQVPANTQLLFSGQSSTADWTVSATNASFSANAATGGLSIAAMAVATYH